MIDLLLLVLIPLATSLAITALAFAILKRFGARGAGLTAASALMFPALATCLSGYILHSGRDLHGIATLAFAALAVLSLPITILTARLLAQRYAVDATTARGEQKEATDVR